jgi:hypothetical protein
MLHMPRESLHHQQLPDRKPSPNTQHSRPPWLPKAIPHQGKQPIEAQPSHIALLGQFVKEAGFVAVVLVLVDVEIGVLADCEFEGVQVVELGL